MNDSSGSGRRRCGRSRGICLSPVASPFTADRRRRRARNAGHPSQPRWHPQPRPVLGHTADGNTGLPGMERGFSGTACGLSIGRTPHRPDSGRGRPSVIGSQWLVAGGAEPGRTPVGPVGTGPSAQRPVQHRPGGPSAPPASSPSGIGPWGTGRSVRPACRPDCPSVVRPVRRAWWPVDLSGAGRGKLLIRCVFVRGPFRAPFRGPQHTKPLPAPPGAPLRRRAAAGKGLPPCHRA